MWGLKAPSHHSDINFPVCTTEVSRSPGASVAGIFLPKSGTQARPIIAQGDGRTQAPCPHRDPHKPCRCPSPLQKSPPEIPRMLGHPNTDNTQALRMPGKLSDIRTHQLRAHRAKGQHPAQGTQTALFMKTQ